MLTIKAAILGGGDDELSGSATFLSETSAGGWPLGCLGESVSGLIGIWGVGLRI